MSASNLDVLGLVVVPLLIFAARIVDVSFGTLRIVFISRDMAAPAAVVGFFESLVWLVAASQIFQNLTSPVYYIAYAAGFAAGNFVGIHIERRLALGRVVVQLTTPHAVESLVEELRASQLGVTWIQGHGARGPVNILHTVVPRRSVEQVIERMQSKHGEAFFAVLPVARVTQGVFPSGRPRWAWRWRRQSK